MKRKTTLAVLYLLLHTAALAGDRGSKIKAELESFLVRYVTATNSHDFNQVQPLLRPQAVYWFNKEESLGLPAIRESFERTWAYLPDEVYGLENVQWLSIGRHSAVFVYAYTYQGTHAGKPVQGRGRGTTLLVKEKGTWRIAHEHLSIPL